MPSPGNSIPIRLQLSDGAINQFPQAIVKKPSGVAISGSPFDLVHSANGLYLPASFPVMPFEQFVEAQYLVYSDAGHTTLNTNYAIVEENFPLTGQSSGGGGGCGMNVILESNDVLNVILEASEF